MDPLGSDQEIDIKAKDEQKCRTDHVSRQIRCEIEEKSRNGRQNDQRQCCYLADQTNHEHFHFLLCCF